MNPPKDNVVRILEGDRGHRTKAAKQKFDVPVPAVPPHRPIMEKEAKKYWNKFVRLYRVGEGDVPAFSYLCQLVAEIKELEFLIPHAKDRFFEKVVIDGAGQENREIKTHPAFSQLVKLRAERRIVEKQFTVRVNCNSVSRDPMEGMIE